MALDLPPKELGCHRTGFEKDCRELVVSGRCNRWMFVQGKDRNTGQDVCRYDCMDNWAVSLHIENTAVQRETGAAVESLRNRVIDQNDAIAVASQRMLLINGGTHDE